MVDAAVPAVRDDRRATLIAALWMGGVLACFMLLAVSVREAGHELTAIQTMFYRSLIALALVVGFALCVPGLGSLRTRRLGAHALRNIFQFSGQLSWFYALGLIPMAQVFAIEFTAPLWVGLLAPLLLDERMTRARALSLLLGFVGILAVVRPGLAEVNSGTLAILCGAVGFALGMIMTKRLAATEKPITVIFYMSLVQGLLSAPPALLDPVTPSWNVLFWVALVAIAGLLAHACLVRALAVADALTVAPMEFLRLPLAMVLAVIVYAEPFDLWILLGGSLILGGNYLNLRAERRRRARR